MTKERVDKITLFFLHEHYISDFFTFYSSTIPINTSYVTKWLCNDFSLILSCIKTYHQVNFLLFLSVSSLGRFKCQLSHKLQTNSRISQSCNVYYLFTYSSIPLA